MFRIHSYNITKTIFPTIGGVICEGIYDLNIKTSYNCRIPFRLYNGYDFNKLIEVAHKYNLPVNKNTLVNVLDLTKSHNVSFKPVWILNTKKSEK